MKRLLDGIAEFFVRGRADRDGKVPADGGTSAGDLPTSTALAFTARFDMPMPEALRSVAERRAIRPIEADTVLLQLARDGKLTIWGTARQDGTTWEAIPAAFWSDNGLSLVDCLLPGATDCGTESKVRPPNAEAKVYCRLRVGREELRRVL